MINSKTLSPGHLLNRYRLARDYMKRRPVCTGFPNEITVELTNCCNLRCIMCPRDRMTRPTGYMDFGLFKKIVDQCVDYTELIDLDLFGESLTHPDVIEMIKYCKAKKLHTMVSTNITRLDGEKSAAVIKSGLDAIIFSLDGATRETYEEIRAGADFEQSVTNLETFLRMKKDLKSKTPFTTVQMIYMEKTKEEAGDFLKRWENTSADAVRLKPFLTLDRDKSYMSALDFDAAYAPCIMLWRKLTIFWDGTAAPCCNDYDKGYVLGDANTRSIKDIWNGEPLQRLRKLHTGGEFTKAPLCKDCKPFEPGTLMILGSILVDDLTVKKLLPRFEKKVIEGSRLMKYS